MRYTGWFAAAAMLFLAARASAQNWADIPSDEAEADFNASKELCRKAKGVKVPEKDRPDAATRKTLRGCNSEALYYGIGMPADPVRARQCAFIEQERADSGRSPDSVLSGRAMLMTVYANGVGAERNLDIAIDQACNVASAPFEFDGRVKHLAELKEKGAAGKSFSFCDNITSGEAQAVCSEHDARLTAQERARHLDTLTAKWSAADRQAFTPLLKARDAFLETRGRYELDLRGTASSSLMLDDKEAHLKAFMALLEELEPGKAPSYAGAKELKVADAELNRVYQAVMKYPDADVEVSWGTVTKAGIKKAQQAWLKYRDAWVAFAKVHDPSVAQEGLLYELTMQRTARLQVFLEP